MEHTTSFSPSSRMAPIAWALVILGIGFAAGHSLRPSAGRYTFQHRPDAVYRYDGIGGAVEILKDGTWQRIATPQVDAATGNDRYQLAVGGSIDGGYNAIKLDRLTGRAWRLARDGQSWYLILD